MVIHYCAQNKYLLPRLRYIYSHHHCSNGRFDHIHSIVFVVAVAVAVAVAFAVVVVAAAAVVAFVFL